MTRSWLGGVGCSAVLALTFPCAVAAQVGATSAATPAAQVLVAQVNVSRGIVRIECGGQRFPAPVGARLKVEDTVITEANGSAVLTPDSQRELENVLSEIKKRPAPDLIVVGHTDRVGSVIDNDRLALRRAEKVRTQFIAQGFAADSISASGRGEREPLVATADEVAEARNRRVEILVR